jgi:hypothetical protein
MNLTVRIPANASRGGSLRTDSPQNELAQNCNASCRKCGLRHVYRSPQGHVMSVTERLGRPTLVHRNDVRDQGTQMLPSIQTPNSNVDNALLISRGSSFALQQLL